MANTIVKSLFSGFGFSTLTKPQRDGGAWFYPIASDNDIFSGLNYVKEFSEIPELNAILNIRARALSSWKLTIESKATGKEQAANQSLVKILRQPNWFQSQNQFWRQSSLNRDIHGNEYLYLLTPVGMPGTYKGMFSLEPSKISIKFISDNVYFNESNDDNVEYWYDLGNGKKMKLEKQNLIHLSDNRVGFQGDGFNKGQFLKGVSKIAALSASIQNIREAYMKRNISLRMPIGILSNNQGDGIGQAVPLNPDEKKSALDNLQSRGAWPILTGLRINYADMKINATNLGLFDEVREDTARICDAFGVPYEILASQKGVTFANLKEAKRQFYEETVIPDANEKLHALNSRLGTDSKSWEIKADFSHLAVFSEDNLNRGRGLYYTVQALNMAFASGAIDLPTYQEEMNIMLKR